MSGGMGLPGGLGGILGNLLGGPGGGRNGALAGVLLGLLSRQGGSGGLAALVQRLRDGGLEEQAQSWVDTGRNQPVSGKELTDALGEDEMVRLAGRAGLTKEETAAALAATLPGVVDAVTPGGELPAAERIDALVDPTSTPGTPEAGSGAEPDAGAEPGDEPAAAVAGTGAEPEADAATGAEAAAGDESGDEAEAEPGAGTGPESASNGTPKPGSDTEPDGEPEPEPASKDESEPGTATGSATEPGPPEPKR
ncbi:YidB family protein [Embleya sp. NPDC056575]|uniref:YidB family protein n=1 Tax=unclassified Embleya TaxID=2699296 RepID=UPI00367E787F